ncbi:hypothetical protein SRABI83_00905 [Arthrobacter sp. Bi83]|nr:hypothetical protein SRABI83_00905 [Arthrobacter sp. Bi83]
MTFPRKPQSSSIRKPHPSIARNAKPTRLVRRTWNCFLGLPATLPAGPPARCFGVQRLRFRWIEFAATQLVTLGVQPDTQLMFFTRDCRFMPRPVLAGDPVRGQGRQTVLPPRLISQSPGRILPARQHRQSIAECRCQRPGTGIAAPPLQPRRQFPLGCVGSGAGRIPSSLLHHGEQLLHALPPLDRGLCGFRPGGRLMLDLQPRMKRPRDAEVISHRRRRCPGKLSDLPPTNTLPVHQHPFRIRRSTPSLVPHGSIMPSNALATTPHALARMSTCRCGTR